jgi:hypothetical protein
MANGIFQNKEGDTSCKRVSGFLLLCSGLLLDVSIVIGTICGISEIIQLKGMSIPIYAAGAGMITGGVFEHKYSKS